MTTDEKTLWEYLCDICRGRAKAERLRDIAAWLGMSTRQVQDLKHSLITNHNKPIASTCSKPFGYYVPATDAEAAEVIAHYEHRRNEMAEMTRCFQRAWTEFEAEGKQRQGTLFDVPVAGRMI